MSISQRSRRRSIAKLPSLLVAINGGLVKITKLSDSGITGDVSFRWIEAEAKPGDWKLVTYVTPESNRKVSDQEVAFLERFKEMGADRAYFNTLLLHGRR